MKKILLFSFLFGLFLLTANVNAKEEQLPDPLYLNSPVLDMDKMEPVEKKKEDPRTFEEKFRAKFKLKPTKKHYYHNIASSPTLRKSEAMRSLGDHDISETWISPSTPGSISTNAP